MKLQKTWTWALLVGLILGIWVIGFIPSIASQLYSDDFEDGNYTGWSKNGGSWSVVTDGTKVFKQAGASATAYAYAGSAWTDYSVQANIKILTFNGTSRPAGICARFQSTGNFYYAVLKSDNTLELGKKVGGNTTTLASKSYQVNTGSWYTIKLAVSGGQLQCYVESALELEATDTTFASGKIGLYTYNTAAEFDEIQVADSEPEATPTPTPTATVTVTPAPTSTSIISEAYYIAPYGSDSNPGTFALPFYSLSQAVSVAEPGDTIYVRGGTYDYSATITISTSGTESAVIAVWAYPGEVPIFDFSGNSSDRRGIMISGSYWHFKGIIIQNSPQHGLTISGGSYNTIENCIARYNHNMGMNITNEAAYNSFINCDSHHNCDEANGGENADGFGAKYGLGSGNVFKLCRAWANSDDGWDLWEAGMGVQIEDCWAYGNGLNFMNLSEFNGDGNGFKLGKGTGTVPHTVIRCLAWGNLLGNGFEDNGYTGGVQYLNCTAYNNAGRNFEAAGTGLHVVKNCLSFMGGSAENIGTQVDATNNSWQGFTVTSDDFVSLDDTVATGDRNQDGTLPESDFLRLASGSDLINGGIDIGLTYLGSAPDLGAYEKE